MGSRGGRLRRAFDILHQLQGVYPLTATGFVVLFASLVALVPYGIYREDRVLLVAGASALVLLGVGLSLTMAATIWLRLKLRDPPESKLALQVGTPGRTGFEVTLPFWLPLVDVRWQVESPQVQHQLVARGRTLVEQWTPHRRGRPGRVVRWFTAGDAFGLTSIRFRLEQPAELRFLPDEGALRQVQVVRGLAAGDQLAHPEGRPQGDLQDIRAYGAGDPIRYVLWKVFAKSRTLVVRSPERALSPVRRTAAYLIAGQDDQAAAGTAKTAFECGALGEEWAFGADSTSQVAKDRRHALEVVLDSAGAGPEAAGAGLARFVAAADDPRRVVVFAPATPGPWVDRVLAVARHTPVELILCVDAVEPAPRAHWSAVVLRDDRQPEPGRVRVTRQALADLTRRLAGVGQVRVVERRSGQIFGSAHLARLTGAA